MSPVAKTLDLIRKLLAKSESTAALGNAEEAAAFAAKANELLLRHKLEMSDVEMVIESEHDPMENDYVDISEALGLRTGKRESWLTSLFTAVAKSHFCVALYVTGSKKVRLVGRKSDREIATYLVTVLAQTARRLAADYARQQKRNQIAQYGKAYASWGVRDTTRVKAAFLVGFVIEVKERLAAMRKDVEEKGGQFALVRFGKADAEAKAAAAPFAKSGSNRLTYGDTNAFNAGKQAGRSVSLHGGLGGSSSSRGTLSRGALLLGR